MRAKTLATQLLVLAAFLLASTPAHASLYQFGFTVNDALTALQTSNPGTFDFSAYYAIFVRPDPAFVTNYSYDSISTPNPTDTGRVWVTAGNTNPTDPDMNAPCTSSPNIATPCYAGFYKDSSNTPGTGGHGIANQPNITVVSANGFFAGADMGGLVGRPPVGYGGIDPDTFLDPYTDGTYAGQDINGLMSGTDEFSFVIDILGTLSGPYTLYGYASAIQSSSDSSFVFDKDEPGKAFMLTVTPVEISAVPEPGTWTLIASGLILTLASRRRLKRAS